MIKNRQIKFRAWNKTDKFFVDLTDKFYNWHLSLNDGSVIMSQNCEDGNFKIQNDIILQQSTGFLDKNGREIYEGDIIKINFGNKGIGRIVYNPCSFMIVNKYSTAFQDTYYCLTTGEVIGNIFENPESLN